ncbi:hypothetical protein K435DRAFT_773714 [Dendrothele bispora CBS 962.96]|uniref:Uncharacterized protein n=1 Tax=Dendrothele bispora (strain CBS 962.96) TaxID=1314807 RepID=A0A4S8MR26_DENBC|nr:hypothetical protein K435DRAFT_773714 [Dendrothele bispora CBS 962.96]
MSSSNVNVNDPTNHRPPLRKRSPPSSYQHSAHSHVPRSLEIQSHQSDSGQGQSSITPPPHSARSSKTSRIMSSVKRSMSVSHGSHKSQLRLELDKTGMYSTPVERDPWSQSRFRKNDPGMPPPSIEQIAMGLHISRTPHLRTTSHSYPSRTVPGPQPHLPVPLPPSRSSLKPKKPSITSSATHDAGATPSASSTAVNSNINSPSSSLTAALSLKARVSRLLSHTTPLPSSKSNSTPKDSETNSSLPPKKAVRFSTPVNKGD